MGDKKGLILFAELRKLWLTHAKSLQENRLLKTNTLECSKNFKSCDFKVGQLIAVKNHLKSMFDTKFISDYRILNIINEYKVLMEKPGKLILKMQSQFQPLQQLTTCYKILNSQC